MTNLPCTLQDILNAPAPGFRCIAAGRKSQEQFIARIRHILHPPASPAALDLISQQLGTHSRELVDFFSKHNGMALYQDTLSESAGFELLPVEQWERATASMRNWFSYLADDPENDPDRILTGIAIATVPKSSNYLVMPIEGPSAGKIFYVDHDGWYESEFATDFERLLDRLGNDPVSLLNDSFGCYTRYSDGKTDLQWIPEEYFADARQPSS